MSMIALPNTLSGLLELAVQDAQKCEALPELYRLDMGQWHTPEAGVCVICMAGAVIAQTLGVSHDADAPDMRAPWSTYLEAVAQLREVGL